MPSPDAFRPPLRHRLFAAYMRTPDHPCKLRLARWLRRLLGLRRVIAPTRQGLMELDPSDYVQIEILRYGAYETQTCRLFETLVREGDVVVDVGANVGQYSLLAARLCGASGRVLALEPNPAIFQSLRRNLELNCPHPVVPLLMAAGSRDAPVAMLEPPPTQLGTSKMAGATAGDYWSGGYRLATILRELVLSRCDVVKIDVEGHEDEVLEGLLQEGAPRPRHIVFEFVPQAFAYGGRAERMLSWLTAAGYALKTIEGRPYESGLELPDHNLWASREQVKA
jgi:FkbM family methyltransferase